MIPFYKIVVNENDETGVDFNAFVDAPAHMKSFISFGKDSVRYSFNEEKRIVTGVMISVGTPIYRRDEQFGEHYVVFDAPTVDLIRKKFFQQGYNTNLNADHDPSKVIKGATLLDSYIINSKDPKFPNPPEAFSEMKLQDGTWIASYHVTDDEIWKGVKDGKFNGFSVEGWFDKVKINIKQNHKKMEIAKFSAQVTSVSKWDMQIEQSEVKLGEKLTILDRYAKRSVKVDAGEYINKEGVKFLVDSDGIVQNMGFHKTPKPEAKKSLWEKVKAAFDAENSEVQKFAEAITADGVTVVYEGELAEGTQLFVVADGEQLPAPEGEHQLTLEDGSVRIVQVDGSGVITSIEEFNADKVTEESTDTELSEQVEEAMSQMAKQFNVKFESQSKEIKSLKAELTAIRKGEKFIVQPNGGAATKENRRPSAREILKNNK